MVYAFFWVISRSLNFICRRFGTLFHIHTQVGVEGLNLRKFSLSTPTCLWRWNSVPKSRHIKFRRRVITQKKTYNLNKFYSKTFNMIHNHFFHYESSTTQCTDSEKLHIRSDLQVLWFMLPVFIAVVRNFVKYWPKRGGTNFFYLFAYLLASIWI
jgi:hypothetical protein